MRFDARRGHHPTVRREAGRGRAAPAHHERNCDHHRHPRVLECQPAEGNGREVEANDAAAEEKGLSFTRAHVIRRSSRLRPVRNQTGLLCCVGRGGAPAYPAHPSCRRKPSSYCPAGHAVLNPASEYQVASYTDGVCARRESLIICVVERVQNRKCR